MIIDNSVVAYYFGHPCRPIFKFANDTYLVPAKSTCSIKSVGSNQ